jgi:hypothetical protein
LLTHAAGSTLFSPTPDLVVAFFEIIIFVLFLNFVYEKDEKLKFKETLPLLLLCSVYLFTLKLSAIVFAFAVFIGATFILIKEHSLKKIHSHKIIFLSGLIVSIHILNSYIMTGMPLYPSPFGRLEILPWAVSLNQANKELLDLFLATTKVTLISNNSSWVLLWPKNLTWINWSYIMFSILITILNIYSILFFKIFNESIYKLFIFCLSVFFAILFWFNTAPDFRYLGALFEIYIFASLLLYMNLISKRNYYFHKIIESKSILIFIIVAIFASAIAAFNFKILISPKYTTLHPRVISQRTPSGIDINIPEGLCWDSPLPCIYSYDRNLDFIVPGDISSGFKMNR